MPESGGDRVFGIHPVRVWLRRRPESVARLWLAPPPDGARIRALRVLARAHGIPVDEAAPRELDTLAGGGNHQGAVAALHPGSVDRDAESGWTDLLARVESVSEAGPATLLLVLDGVQDPHNLGACLRSAAAAGAHAVVVPRRRAAGMTPVVERVASGAAGLVPLVRVTNLARALSALRARAVSVVGADAGAREALYDADLRGAVALVLGGEGRGLRRLTADACDHLVRIPMPGPMESLNVSVAAGVLLFEAVRQRGTQPDRAPFPRY